MEVSQRTSLPSLRVGSRRRPSRNCCRIMVLFRAVCVGAFILCARLQATIFFFFEVSKCCMDTFFASRNRFPDHLPPCKSGRARKEVLAGCGADTFSLCECKVRDDLLRPFNFFLLFQFHVFLFSSDSLVSFLGFFFPFILRLVHEIFV